MLAMSNWERAYNDKKGRTPDLSSDFADIDDALEEWDMSIVDVVRDGQDDVLVLLSGGPGRAAVAFVESGCWSAHRIAGGEL